MTGTGPFASLLVKKYGCRTVTIVGAVLAAVSLFVSYFAKNLPTLIITIGKKNERFFFSAYRNIMI